MDINDPNYKKPTEWERLPDESLDDYNKRIAQYGLRVQERPKLWENPDFGLGGTKQIMNPGSLAFLKDDRDLVNAFGIGTAGRFQNYYQPGQGSSEKMFQELLGNINAPSSVDAVQKGLESQGLQELLGNIDTSTRKSAGSLKADFLERGLGGPGQMSDIESSGLGQVYGEGNKAKTAASLDYQLKDLERQKARETAAMGAYGTRYAGGLASDTQGKDIAAKGALSDAATYSDLLKTGATLNQKADVDWATIVADLEKTGESLTSQERIALAELLNRRDLEQGGIQAGKYARGSSGDDDSGTKFNFGWGPTGPTFGVGF